MSPSGTQEAYQLSRQRVCSVRQCGSMRALCGTGAIVIAVSLAVVACPAPRRDTEANR